MLSIAENFDAIVLLAALSAIIGIAVKLYLQKRQQSKSKVKLISNLTFISCLAISFFGYFSLFH